MTKVLNVLICLCTAVYMHMRFTQGAGSLEIDIPNEYFRNSLSYWGISMHETYHFVLWVLCFECLVLVLSKVYDRFLKDRFKSAKSVGMAFLFLRLLVDVGCISFMSLGIAFEYMLAHQGNSFEYVDENGEDRNYKILVRDLGSEQE